MVAGVTAELSRAKASSVGNNFESTQTGAWMMGDVLLVGAHEVARNEGETHVRGQIYPFLLLCFLGGKYERMK
jgi:hypothetical protein